MKKIILVLALLIGFLSANAQTFKVKFTPGKYNYPVNNNYRYDNWNNGIGISISVSFSKSEGNKITIEPAKTNETDVYPPSAINKYLNK